MSHPVHRALINGDSAFATTLAAILVDEFGTEAMSWTPKTIIMEMESVHGGKMSHSSIDRLMAAITVLTSNSFYASLPDFNDLCNVFSWEPITPGVFNPADAAECAWGITEVMLLSPADDDDPFTEEIKAFVSATMKSEGIINPPDILKLSNFDKEMVSKVTMGFSDDPEMFDAIYAVEADKTKDINDFVKKRLRALVMQLSSLNLKNGSVEEIAKKLLSLLPAQEQRASNALLAD
jgi:hypothetical protein